jgi:hypothetical protein
MSNLKTAHQDAALKGVALGILTYAATKYGIADEAVAVAIPVVAIALSVVSTKIGDKNTALLLNLAQKAIEQAPAKKAPAKKAPAKKK